MVYAKEPLGGPEAVLDYLGRSGTHRVAISNERSRAWVTPAYLPGNGSVAMTTAEVDLTVPANSNKARCSCLTTTGALRGCENIPRASAPGRRSRYNAVVIDIARLRA